jgi:hypothetical protein
MIENINISFKQCGLDYSITIPTDNYENVPYLLASAFVELVEKSDANKEFVIEQMKGNLQV